MQPLQYFLTTVFLSCVRERVQLSSTGSPHHLVARVVASLSVLLHQNGALLRTVFIFRSQANEAIEMPIGCPTRVLRAAACRPSLMGVSVVTVTTKRNGHKMAAGACTERTQPGPWLVSRDQNQALP